MFTGIIQCLGTVTARHGSGNEARFSIMPQKTFASPQVGESIAVNGVCLTAESFDKDTFTAYASEETLTVSTLGSLTRGSSVNLERAATLNTFLGGHLVSGHIDGLAKVTNVSRKGDSTVFRLDFPGTMGHLVVPKGSVALDGVSLTVNECGTDFLTVNVIPETLKATTLHTWKVGSSVNIETDVIGKYIARMLQTGFSKKAENESANLTLEFFQNNGF